MTHFKPYLSRFLICLGLLLAYTNTFSQVYNYADGEGPTPPDSVKGLYVGLNLGVYFANKNTAFVYDGRGYNRDGAFISPQNNFFGTWLSQAIQGSITAQNRTSRAMEDKAGYSFSSDDWLFELSDMPNLMTYSGSFLYGGHLRYMFNSDFGVFLELNGTNPVTIGEFTIQDKQSTGTDPSQVQTLQRFAIRGEEQRLMINAGMHRVLLRKSLEQQGKSSAILPYFDAGFNMTFVKYEANFIEMAGEGVVDLMNFFNNQGQYQYSANVLTGIGFGGFVGAGGQITIGRKFTIDMGYVASFETIKLGEVKKLGLQNQLVFKAIYM